MDQEDLEHVFVFLKNWMSISLNWHLFCVNLYNKRNWFKSFLFIFTEFIILIDYFLCFSVDLSAMIFTCSTLTATLLRLETEIAIKSYYYLRAISELY